MSKKENKKTEKKYLLLNIILGILAIICICCIAFSDYPYIFIPLLVALICSIFISFFSKINLKKRLFLTTIFIALSIIVSIVMYINNIAYSYKNYNFETYGDIEYRVPKDWIKSENGNTVYFYADKTDAFMMMGGFNYKSSTSLNLDSWDKYIDDFMKEFVNSGMLKSFKINHQKTYIKNKNYYFVADANGSLKEENNNRDFKFYFVLDTKNNNCYSFMINEKNSIDNKFNEQFYHVTRSIKVKK
jgi:hypothetical protein